MEQTEVGGTEPNRTEVAVVRPARRVSRTDGVFAVLLVVASLLVGLFQVPKHAAISPIDEYVYIDYVAKVPTEGVVRGGELTGGYARETLACRGVRLIGLYPRELCETAATAPDSAFPTGGTNSADIYTPLYFAVTWVLAQPLRWFGVDLTDAARLTGWVWLAAAVVLLYASLRRLRAGPWLAFGLGMLLAGSLPAFWSNTYVSTDATALTAGAAMLYGVLRLERGSRFGVLVLAALATLATLAKLQNYGAVAVAVVYLLLRAGWAASRSSERGVGAWLTRWARDSRFRAAVVVAAVPVLFEVVWMLIRSAIRVGDSVDQGTSTHFGLTALVEEAFKFFAGPANGAVDGAVLGPIGLILATVLSWVIVSGVLGTAVVERRGSRGESLAVASFGIAVLIGPALAVVTIVSAGYYFALPARYGIPLIPFYLACAGMLYRRKPWVGNALAAVGVVCFGLSFLLPAG